MNTIKTSQLPAGTTLNPSLDIIEVSQWSAQTLSYTSIKAHVGGLGGIARIGSGVLNMNTTASQAISINGGSNFNVHDILVYGASVNLTTASNGNFYTGINNTGNFIATTYFGLSESLAYLTNSGLCIYFDNGIANAYEVYTTAMPIIQNTIYFKLTTPQGATATANYIVLGTIIS